MFVHVAPRRNAEEFFEDLFLILVRDADALVGNF